MPVAQVDCKICLKSARLHKSFGWFWLVLCCVVCSRHRKMPQLWWSVQGRNNKAELSMNCSKIGHSYEAFISLFGQNNLIRLLSAKNISSVYLSKLVITGNFWINQWFWVGGFQSKNCEEFYAISHNHFAKIPRKLGVSIRPFYSQIVCTVYISSSWWLSHFSWKREVRTALTIF